MHYKSIVSPKVSLQDAFKSGAPYSALESECPIFKNYIYTHVFTSTSNSEFTFYLRRLLKISCGIKDYIESLKMFSNVPEYPGSYADYAIFIRNVVYASKSQIEKS